MICKIRIFLHILLILLVWSCTPYNVNESNTKLIQGKWELIDADRKAYDSVEVNYSHQTTYLIFDGDKCSQQMLDIKEVSDYRFLIHNYDLELYNDTVLVNMLKIGKLTKDSLILTQGRDSQWKYKKIEQ